MRRALAVVAMLVVLAGLAACIRVVELGTPPDAASGSNHRDGGVIPGDAPATDGGGAVFDASIDAT